MRQYEFLDQVIIFLYKIVIQVSIDINKKYPFSQVILQEKVHNPEKAAKRKLQLKEKKKQAKKMKLDTMHGKRPKARKRRMEDIDIEEKLLQDD